MHHSQLDQIYRELKEGDPTRPQSGLKPPAFAHCLTVHWENGEEWIFYYAFLMSVRLHLLADHNLLVLRFTSERLMMKGYQLKPLCRSLAHEKPSEIQVCNPRYIAPESVSQPVIIEAVVEERKS